MMQAGLIYAKKFGKKVLIDLNSIDDLYGSLPNVGAADAAR
jgi:hypothetical protein